jgi:hypothetical protein
MHLTHQEENELVHWITTLTERGYARYRTTLELAGLIRNRRVVGINDEDIQLVNYEEFGKDWVPRFMLRHPQLASARRTLIEAARIKDVSAERSTRWFEDLQKIIEEHNRGSQKVHYSHHSTDISTIANPVKIGRIGYSAPIFELVRDYI